jgi:hypothetical protein
MGRPTYGVSAFGAVPGIVELHSTPPPAGPEEDDDCKSSIPGCRCSATRPGVACARPDEPGLAGMVELHSTPPPAAPAEDDDCKSSIPGCRCSATRSGVACGRPDEHGLPGMVELHSTPPPAAPEEDDDCKSSIPGCRTPDRRRCNALAWTHNAAALPLAARNALREPFNTRIQDHAFERNEDVRSRHSPTLIGGL